MGPSGAVGSDMALEYLDWDVCNSVFRLIGVDRLAHDRDYVVKNSEIRLGEATMVHDGRSEAKDIGVAAIEHMEGKFTIDKTRQVCNSLITVIIVIESALVICYIAQPASWESSSKRWLQPDDITNIHPTTGLADCFSGVL